jgi:hypothetical protein
MHEAKFDSEVAAAVAASQSLGGRAMRLTAALDLGDNVDLGSPEGCRRVLEAASRAVAKSQITSAQAQALASLVNSAIRVAELQLAGQVREMEDRVARLADRRAGR